MPSSINIGPLTIHLYGLIIAVAILAGWLLAKKRAHIHKISPNLFEDPILFFPFAGGIVGGRLYHVIDKWSFYSENLTIIFQVWRGGLGIWGALLGIFLGFWIVAKVRKIDFVKILDLASPSILLGQAFGRFGNFVNQEAFGPPTNLPWAIYINPENRPSQFNQSTHFHPTFFYEAILDAIFFFILIYLSKRLRVKGQIFAMYLILYSLGRFIVEFWRIDTWTVGILKVAHLLAAATFLLGILLLIKIQRLRG